MGFFSSILKVGGGIVRGILGVPAAAPAVASVVKPGLSVGARALSAGRRIAPIAAAGAVFGAGDVAAQSLLSSGSASTAGGGGNGRTRTATLVRTVDAVSGDVISERILQGSPFLMNRDLAIAKRVLKTAGKLGQKFNRKTREKSKRAVLLDAIEDKAISQALGVNCPS